MRRHQRHTQGLCYGVSLPDADRASHRHADYHLWDTFTWNRRLKAQRELQTVQPQTERLVKQLFRELDHAEGVTARLRTDQTLSEPFQRAAWHAVLRHVTEQQQP